MTPIDLYNNAVRSKEIIGVLARYGFGDILRRLPTPPNWLSKWVPEYTPKSPWVRIRYSIEELGATFIKIGQILSTRTDVLPPELIEELRKLNSQVSATPFEDMEAILNQEIKKPYQTLFSSFNTQPIACGSLGQVYKASLVENNQTVSVKIQRPRLRKSVEADMEILGWLAKQMHNRIENIRPYDLPGILIETRHSILRELNFELEAKNATLFNLSNPYPDQVFAPNVLQSLSTKRVLIAEWVEGKNIAEKKLGEEDSLRVAEYGCRSVLHQIIESGFFHADPHTGNLLISEDNRLCFLDWGMVGQITSKMRFNLADLLSAILDQDAEKIIQVALKMSKNDHRYDLDKLEKAINLVLLNNGVLEGQFSNLGEAGIEILFALSNEGLPLSRDYAILAKALYSIEKSGKELAPNFKIDKIAVPFVKKIVLQKINPVRLTSSFINQISLLANSLKSLPLDIQRIVRKLEEEDLNINLYHKGIDDAKETLRLSADHLSLAVVCAGFLVGSSIIVTTGMKPHLFGHPALGIIGYIISGLLGLFLMIDIIWARFKSRK